MEQVLDPEKRDTFVPKPDCLEILESKIEDNDGVFTSSLGVEVFDALFDRTYNVHFVAQTLKAWQSYLKSDFDGDRPAMLLKYSPTRVIRDKVSHIVARLNQKDIFDLYLDCSEQYEPYEVGVTIVDKSETEPIKPSCLALPDEKNYWHRWEHHEGIDLTIDCDE